MKPTKNPSPVKKLGGIAKTSSLEKKLAKTKPTKESIRDRQKTLNLNLKLIGDSTESPEIKEMIRKMRVKLKHLVALRKERTEKRMEHLLEIQILEEKRRNTHCSLVEISSKYNAFVETKDAKVNFIHDFVDKFVEVDEFLVDKTQDMRIPVALRKRFKGFTMRGFLFKSNYDQLVLKEIRGDIAKTQIEVARLLRENEELKRTKRDETADETQESKFILKLNRASWKKEQLLSILSELENKADSAVKRNIEKEMFFETTPAIESGKRTAKAVKIDFFTPEEPNQLVKSILDFTGIEDKMLDISVINKNWDVSAIKKA